jgi:hypothetical protein
MTETDVENILEKETVVETGIVVKKEETTDDVEKTDVGTINNKFCFIW